AAAHAGLGRACSLLDDRTGAATHFQWVAERLATRTEPRLVAQAAAALQSQAELSAGPQPAEAVALLQNWLSRYGDHAAPAVRALLPGSLLTLAQAATAVADNPALDAACGRLLDLAPAGDPRQVGQTAAALSSWVAQLVTRDSAHSPAGWSSRVREWFRLNESAATTEATATRFTMANWLTREDSPAAALTAWEELLDSRALQAATAAPADLARARSGRAHALELAGRVPEARSAWGSVVELLTPDAAPEVVELVAAALDRQTTLFAPATPAPAGDSPASEAATSLATELRRHHQQVLQRVESRSEPRFARAIAKALAALGGEGPDGPADPTAHERLIQRFAAAPDGEVRGEVVAALVARAERAEARADTSTAVEVARRATTLGADLAGERIAGLVRRAWLVSATACDRLDDLPGQSAAVAELVRRTSGDSGATPTLSVQRAQVSLARKLVGAGRAAEAITLFDGLLKQVDGGPAQGSSPANREVEELTAAALLERGLARASLGEVEAALDDLGGAATRWAACAQPVHAEPLARALHAQATLLQQTGDLEGEARVRDQLVEVVGTNTDPAVAQWVALALVQSGELREKLGRRSEVVELLERVITRHANAGDPRLLEPLSRALLLRAFNHLRLGNLPAALESAREVRGKFASQAEPALVETVRRAEGLIQKVEQILQAVQMDSDALPTTSLPTRGLVPPTPIPSASAAEVAPPASAPPGSPPAAPSPSAAPELPPAPTAGTPPGKSSGPAAASGASPAKRPPAKSGAATGKNVKEPATKPTPPPGATVAPASPAKPAPAAPASPGASPIVEAQAPPATESGPTALATAPAVGKTGSDPQPGREPVSTPQTATPTAATAGETPSAAAGP
ncbi:MAG: hypothetical protein ACKOJF_07990, partial [Planctomycetaceae bacterium]